MGLSWLDLDYNTDICVKATAEDVSVDHFTVGIIPGTGSNVYSAACSWLEASANEPDIKMGQWNLASEWRSKTKPAGGKTSTSIKFDQRFDGGEAALQRLQQAHEVPHGKDVCFHEQPQVFEGDEGAVQRVGGQLLIQRLQTGLQGFNASHGILDSAEQARVEAA